MWVTVIGSMLAQSASRGWSYRHEAADFETACCEIGRHLAVRGHELLVAHTEVSTADKFAKNGFDAAKSAQQSVIFMNHASSVWAEAHLDAIEHADAVIAIGGGDGTYTAGQAALLSGKRVICIPCFGGAAEHLARLKSAHRRVSFRVLNAFEGLNPKEDPNWIDQLRSLVDAALSEFPRILIIHGRKANDKKILKSLLCSNRPPFDGMPPPVIMSEETRAARQIPELFERLAEEVDAAIGLITADDIGASIVDPHGQDLPAIAVRDLQLRARQNIWVEVGWFWGRLGMDRVMLLQQGSSIERPSDLGAMIVHDYVDSPMERQAQIRGFVDGIRYGGPRGLRRMRQAAANGTET